MTYHSVSSLSLFIARQTIETRGLDIKHLACWPLWAPPGSCSCDIVPGFLPSLPFYVMIFGNNSVIGLTQIVLCVSCTKVYQMNPKWGVHVWPYIRPFVCSFVSILKPLCKFPLKVLLVPFFKVCRANVTGVHIVPIYRLQSWNSATTCRFSKNNVENVCIA
jgi:hypothetical protein